MRRAYGQALARWPELTRGTLFCTVGIAALGVDAGTFLALTAAGLDHRAARALSFWPAATASWALHREITFAGRGAARKAREWGRFATSALVGAGVSIGTYLALTASVETLERHPLLALAAGSAASALVSFTLASQWVFPARGETDTEPPDKAG